MGFDCGLGYLGWLGLAAIIRGMSAVRLTNKLEYINAAADDGMRYFLDGQPIAYRSSKYKYIPVIDGGGNRGMKLIAKVPSSLSLSLLETDYISEQETLVTTIIGTFPGNETNRFLLDNLSREAHTMRVLLPAAHLKMQGAANILYFNTFIANFDNKTPMSIFNRFTDFIEDEQSQNMHGGWLNVARQLFLAMKYIHSQGFAYNKWIGPYDVVYTDDDTNYQGRKYMLMNFEDAIQTTQQDIKNIDIRYLAKFLVSQAQNYNYAYTEVDENVVRRVKYEQNIRSSLGAIQWLSKFYSQKQPIDVNDFNAYCACLILASNNTIDAKEFDISYKILSDLLGISEIHMLDKLQSAMQAVYTNIAHQRKLFAAVTAINLSMDRKLRDAIVHFIRTLADTSTWQEKAKEGTFGKSRSNAVYSEASRLMSALSRSPFVLFFCYLQIDGAYRHYIDPYFKYRNTLQTVTASRPETEEYV